MKPERSATAHERLYAALLELVECKDLKDSLDSQQAKHMLTDAHLEQGRAEYERRKPAAWDVARGALISCVPSETRLINPGEQEAKGGRTAQAALTPEAPADHGPSAPSAGAANPQNDWCTGCGPERCEVPCPRRTPSAERVTITYPLYWTAHGVFDADGRLIHTPEDIFDWIAKNKAVQGGVKERGDPRPDSSVAAPKHNLTADELDSIAEHELAKHPAAARIVRNVATFLRSSVAATGERRYDQCPDCGCHADGEHTQTCVVGQLAKLHLQKIGMCPWCGEALHPGRCHNNDARCSDIKEVKP